MNALELDVHHRLAAVLIAAQRFCGEQFPSLVALDADYRVQKAMDGELSARDYIGDGINEERHVVVDDSDAHPPMARFAPGRFDGDGHLPCSSLRSNGGEELSRLLL